MTDPIQTLRGYIGEWDETLGTSFYNHADATAALTQVENLVRAARNALPCVDRNATFPAQMLADALAPFGDTP